MADLADLIADAQAFGGLPFGPKTLVQHVMDEALLVLLREGLTPQDALLRVMGYSAST